MEDKKVQKEKWETPELTTFNKKDLIKGSPPGALTEPTFCYKGGS